MEPLSWFRNLLSPEEQAKRRRRTNEFVRNEGRDFGRVSSYLDALPEVLAGAAQDPAAPMSEGQIAARGRGVRGIARRAGEQVGRAARRHEQYEPEAMGDLDPAMQLALQLAGDPTGMAGDVTKAAPALAAIMPFLRASRNNPKARAAIEEATRLSPKERTYDRFLELMAEVADESRDPAFGSGKRFVFGKTDPRTGLRNLATNLIVSPMEPQHWDAVGRQPEEGVYVDLLNNVADVGDPESANAVSNFLDLLDAMQLPSANTPGAFGSKRFENEGLASIYNRAGYEPTRTSMMYREPVPTDPAQRRAEQKRRLSEYTQQGRGVRGEGLATPGLAGQRAPGPDEMSGDLERLHQMRAQIPADRHVTLSDFPEIRRESDIDALYWRGLITSRELWDLTQEFERINDPDRAEFLRRMAEGRF